MATLLWVRAALPLIAAMTELLTVPWPLAPTSVLRTSDMLSGCPAEVALLVPMMNKHGNWPALFVGSATNLNQTAAVKSVTTPRLPILALLVANAIVPGALPPMLLADWSRDRPWF